MTEDKLRVPVKRRDSSFADPLRYKIQADTELKFTKGDAYKFLELGVFEGERPIRESHVQFLYDEWVAGRFLWQNVILASVKCGDREFRINGQHTCWMRVSVPEKNEPLDPMIRMMVYIVNGREQMRALYSAFDRNTPRSAGHVSKVMLMDTEASKEIPASYIGRIVAGFRIFWEPEGNKRARLCPPELVGLIEKNYSRLFNIVGRFFTMRYSDSVVIRRAGVVGAMFATFERNVQKSDEFWSPVLTALGLNDKQDPRWQLRRYLEEHGHSMGSSVSIAIKTEETYAVCVNAWNHWRAGTPITRLVTTDRRMKARS